MAADAGLGRFHHSSSGRRHHPVLHRPQQQPGRQFGIGRRRQWQRRAPPRTHSLRPSQPDSTNAKIQSVTLTLMIMAQPATTPAPSSFVLHRVMVDWGEGTGTGKFGNIATNGQATWTARFYPATQGCRETPPRKPRRNNHSNPADVQGWLNNPANNFGWILLSQSETTPYTVRLFASREDTLNAPALQVQYLLPTRPRILGIDAFGGSIQITFLAVAGQSYWVEYRDSLNSGFWSTLTNLPPLTVTTNQIVTDILRSHRCYRIGTSF